MRHHGVAWLATAAIVMTARCLTLLATAQLLVGCVSAPPPVAPATSCPGRPTSGGWVCSPSATPELVVAPTEADTPPQPAQPPIFAGDILPTTCTYGDAERCELSCRAGQLSSCGLLGAMVLLGDGVREDHARAAALSRRACEGGVMRGCNTLAVLYERGQSIPVDQARALALYERACSGGEPRACMNLGNVHLHGKLGLRPDRGASASHYSLACAMGFTEGCATAGNVLAADGRHHEAFPLFKRACNAGQMEGCNGLGTSYARGVGTPKDYALAARYFEQACRGGAGSGCKGMGDLHAGGYGVPRDTQAAKTYYRRACSMGYQNGCHQLLTP